MSISYNDNDDDDDDDDDNDECVTEAEHGYACREPPKRPLRVQSRTTRPYRRQRQVFKLSTSFNRKSSSCR